MPLDRLRPLLFGFIATLLVAGYAASQWYVVNGLPEKWMSTIDTPSVSYLALGVFVVTIIFGSLRGEKS